MRSATVSIAKKAGSIILCRQHKRHDSYYNYQILMLERKSSLAFGSVMAFPGGKYDEEIDQSIQKRNNIEKIMFTTGLRQCFEQTGLFLSENPIVQTQKIAKLRQIKNQYIAQSLQKGEVDHLPYFLKLCDILGPMKIATEFIRLITVPILPKRFDTSFYVTCLKPYQYLNFNKYAQNEKDIHCDKNFFIEHEFESFQWMNPLQVIRKFTNKQIKLAQPQYIMLNIMSSFHNYHDFQDFLKNCSRQPTNMAPNIVTLIRNEGYNKAEFPYAATLVADQGFPFEQNIETEKCEDLKKQLGELKGAGGKEKNRFLFKNPKSYFEDEYDVECTVEGSVLNRFNNWKKMKQILSHSA